MVAEEIMTKNPVTVNEDATLGEALEILSEHNIRHLPVVRNGEVIGMLSDRDLRSLGISLISDIEAMDRFRSRISVPVTSLMSGDVLTIDIDTSVREIVEIMLSENVGAIPVIDTDTGNLVGIVSYVDVLRAVQDQLD